MNRPPRVALLRLADDGTATLLSPTPGRFRAAVVVGDTVHGGTALGALEILGQVVRVIAPDGARGVVTAIADPSLARAPVEFGGMLVTIDPRGAGAGLAVDATSSTTHGPAIDGLVFRSPTSGRFYGRSSPDKPAFVTVGTALAPGTTIGLLEVMKTFHRVTYGGAAVPERARVREVLVTDGADVNAGDPLLALDPA